MDEKPHMPEVATVLGGRDITRGYVDGLPTLPPTDRILALAGGWRGYEELLRDDQVQATFSQRRLAVVRKPWSVEPGGPRRDDKRAAELVRQTLDTLPWDDITDQMLYARFFGFAVAEILWEAGADGIRVRDIRVRDRARFAFAPDGSPRMFTMSAPNGEALPERKFWVASVGASHHDEPYGRGLANALYWPVWFKRNGARFWAVYLEKFGAPTPVGKFPKGTEEAERRRLLQALQAIQTDAGVIIPEGMVVELLEATRGGNAGFREWMEYWDGAVAKTVLGQTMTTDDGSSLAQAQVHMQVREDFVASDADLICASAGKSWVRWLVEYNFPGAAVPRVWRETEVQEDLKTRAERDTALAGLGYRLTPDAVKRVYGDDYEDAGESGGATPAPASPAEKTGTVPREASPAGEDGNVPVLSPGEGGSVSVRVCPCPSVSVGEDRTVPAFSEPGGTPPPFPDQEALDRALDGISQETLDDPARALLEPVMRALADAGDNPAAFLGWLAEHYPAQSPDDLEDLFTRLIFVAGLWGDAHARTAE